MKGEKVFERDYKVGREKKRIWPAILLFCWVAGAGFPFQSGEKG